MRKIYRLHLQRFAEAGDASSQAAAGGTGADTQQAAAAETTGNTETEAPQKASFKEMIKAEYKEDFDREVQGILKSRLAKAKQTEQKATQYQQQLQKLGPLLQAMAVKYNVNADDIDSIVKFAEEDEELYEEAAAREHMDVSQYMRFSKLEQENARIREQQKLDQERRIAQERYNQWLQESEQIKGEFPDFDLNTCIQNERFQQLLRSGVGLRDAYMVMNIDNILPEAMSYTAQQVARKTADTIAQRGLRPVEGGISNRAASKASTDVSKLSNAQIAEYVRRTMAGERITF